MPNAIPQQRDFSSSSLFPWCALATSFQFKLPALHPFSFHTYSRLSQEESDSAVSEGNLLEQVWHGHCGTWEDRKWPQAQKKNEVAGSIWLLGMIKERDGAAAPALYICCHALETLALPPSRQLSCCRSPQGMHGLFQRQGSDELCPVISGNTQTFYIRNIFSLFLVMWCYLTLSQSKCSLILFFTGRSEHLVAIFSRCSAVHDSTCKVLHTMGLSPVQ